jgi:epoxyqueuosine reductase
MESAMSEISKAVKALALKSGFTACGIAPAGRLSKDSERLREWLDTGMHAGMYYMENHFNGRINPSVLVPGAKSVIVVLLNYFPGEQQKVKDNFIVSKYAYGQDYHHVMRYMLQDLFNRINESIIPMKGRVFVDSAPVLERALAALAGLGWIGKNANLISPKYGSFCFIGELIVDVDLACDTRISDLCGTCTKCIQACPTNAIRNNRTIDSRKCIAYWTIEHKGMIDETLKGKFRGRIFGCDICQDVCPWNRKAMTHAIKDFLPLPEIYDWTKEEWCHLSEKDFARLFSNSPIKRTGYQRLKRNIAFVLS